LKISLIYYQETFILMEMQSGKNLDHNYKYV